MKTKTDDWKAFTIRVPKSIHRVLKELSFYLDMPVNHIISSILAEELSKWIKYSKAEENVLEDGTIINEGLPEEIQKFLLNEIKKAQKEIGPIIVPYPVKDEDITWKD